MDCEHQYVATTKKRAVTPQGVFGVILAIAGFIALVGNVIVGGVLILVGIVIGMIGREKTVIRCAKCGDPSPS